MQVGRYVSETGETEQKRRKKIKRKEKSEIYFNLSQN